MPLTRTTATIATTAAAGLAAAGCGGSPRHGEAAPAGHHVTIAIRGFRFTPPDVTVARGARVTFVEEDAAAHTATSDAPGGFDTGVLRRGGRRTLTVTRPGRIAYHCDLHPFMKAALTVEG